MYEFPKKTIFILEDVQEKFNYFASMTENSIKLTIGTEKNRFPFEKFDQKIPADSALRFSF